MTDSLAYKCPECGEQFLLTRDSGEARHPFPQDWFLTVVHDHDREPMTWRAIVYHHSQRERYPAETKEIQAKQAAHRKAAVERNRRDGGNRRERSN